MSESCKDTSQDEKFIKIMSHADDNNLVEIPDGLDTFEEFQEWLDEA